MARRATLRASDADRELIADRLRRAAAEGRLLAEELEQRIGAVFSSRTYGELDALVADLPDDRLAPHRQKSLARMGTPAMAVGIAIVALAIVAIVAVLLTGTALLGGAWIFFALWGFGCRGSRCRTRYARYPRRGW